MSQRFHIALKLFIIVLTAVIFLCFSMGAFVLNPTQSSVPETIAKPPYNGMVSYIINLKHSKDRYAYIYPKVHDLGLPVERIDAVYGKDLPQEKIKKIVDISKYNRHVQCDPSPGTIGCTLSHIKTWQHFLKSSYEYAVVFEDDVTFVPSKIKSVLDALLENSKLWDVVSLNYQKIRPHLKRKTLTDDAHLAIYLGKIVYTGAYVINRAAAKKLLEKALPITMPVDMYFTRSWELGVRFTAVHPILVTQSFGDSEIEKTDTAKCEYSKNKASKTFTGKLHTQIFKNFSEFYRALHGIWQYVTSYF